MGKSLSDRFTWLGVVPRWVWVILFILLILLRLWLLALFMGIFIIVIFLLTILGIIAFAEIVDDDGPGHKGNSWWKR